MSTIASPRASSSIRSPSSTRNSFDSSARPPPNARRNRAALRDYYGIKNAQKDADAKISEESTRTGLGPEEDETLTELDAVDFNAEAFVDSLLAKEGLKGVLKVEADLVSRVLCCIMDILLFADYKQKYGTSIATESHSSTITTRNCSPQPVQFERCVGIWIH